MNTCYLCGGETDNGACFGCNEEFDAHNQREQEAIINAEWDGIQAVREMVLNSREICLDAADDAWKNGRNIGHWIDGSKICKEWLRRH